MPENSSSSIFVIPMHSSCASTNLPVSARSQTNPSASTWIDLPVWCAFLISPMILLFLSPTSAVDFPTTKSNALSTSVRTSGTRSSTSEITLMPLCSAKRNCSDASWTTRPRLLLLLLVPSSVPSMGTTPFIRPSSVVCFNNKPRIPGNHLLRPSRAPLHHSQRPILRLLLQSRRSSASSANKKVIWQTAVLSPPHPPPPGLMSRTESLPSSMKTSMMIKNSLTLLSP